LADTWALFEPLTAKPLSSCEVTVEELTVTVGPEKRMPLADRELEPVEVTTKSCEIPSWSEGQQQQQQQKWRL